MAEQSLMNAYLALIPKLDSSAKRDIETDVADAGDKASAKFGKALGTAGKAAAATIGAALVGLGKIGADAFRAFADFEQLSGGIDTLFGEGTKAAEMVKKQAADAYKSAGMSANAYMETVTGFSASLLQSLGGDAEEAARIADMAITDMSDNANKMGTDIASIQVAYQGFAKGNFTMLDNLKLGYGGTKSEMERLIARANELAKAQGRAADLSIDSYADIVQAINIVQEEMGILGTTSREAEETITGSLSMLTGSWQNFIAGLGNPDADLDSLVSHVMSSIQIVASNVLPTVTRIGNNLVTQLPALVKMIADTIVSLFPTILDAAVTIAVSLAHELPGMVQTLVEVLTAEDTVQKLIDGAIEIALALVGAVPQLIATLAPAIPRIVSGVVTGIIEHLPDFIAAAIDVVTGLVDAIPDIIVGLIDAIPDIVKSLKDAFSDEKNKQKMIDAGKQLGASLMDGVKQVFSIESLFRSGFSLPGMVLGAVSGTTTSTVTNNNNNGGNISIGTLNVTGGDTNDLILAARRAASLAGKTNKS